MLRQLMQEGVDLSSKTVQINVPEKDKDIVKLTLPLCKDASDSITWQKQVVHVFKSHGLEPFLTTASYCTFHKDSTTAYSTKLLESLLRFHQGWLVKELESEKSSWKVWNQICKQQRSPSEAVNKTLEYW